MKGKIFSAVWLLLLLTSAFARTDDGVTVPKSRLEELERKEAELEKLKHDLNKTKGENVQLKQQHDADAQRIAQSPTNVPPPHISPPLASLPPVAEGETIDAMDLANYYHTDAASADQRFGNRVLKVKGEIVGFYVVPFTRLYKIFLKTPDRGVKVICSFTQPEKFKSVFTVDYGEKLVGLLNETRVPIAKVGDTAVIQGHCRQSNPAEVNLSRCDLKAVQ